MRLPSFKTVTESASATLRRFPLPLIIAFIGTALFIYIVDVDGDPPTWVIQILFICFIGLPAMLGTHLYAERLEHKTRKWVAILLGLVLVVLYGLLLAPKDHELDRDKMLLFFVLNICMHLWVAVAAFINKKESYGFWHFNDVLFIRIILAVIFSGALYGGLCLAIVSLDELFGMPIDGKIYLKLFLFIGGVFNTWFFLSGIPKDYAANNEEQPFPKGLKVFTQYILIPLAIIYLTILYAYGLKIVAQWSLPRGWVSALIMFYSLVGVLAVLLVYPLREQAQHAWVRLFAKFFFIALIPLLVLLFVAIYARVSDYGITEPRYYLILLGSWLTLIALYYTFSKKKNIKLIPISLLLFGLASLFGPWNTFKVSERSQANRLKKIYTKHEVFGEKKSLQSLKNEEQKEDAKQVHSILNYLVERKSDRALSSIYDTDISELRDKISDKYSARWRVKDKMVDTLMSMAAVSADWTNSSSMDYYNVYAETKTLVTEGYSQVYTSDVFASSYPRHDGENKHVVLADSMVLSIEVADDYSTLKFLNEEQIVATINLKQLTDRMKEKGDRKRVPLEEMTLVGTGDLKVKMAVRELSFNFNEYTGKTVIYDMVVDILFE